MSSWLVEYRPPRIAQLLILVAVLLHWIAPMPAFQYSIPWLGGLILGAGLCVMLAGWWLFKRRQTAICPTDTPSHLVTEGVYRFTRNPMYLGIFAMMLGLALIVGSLPFYASALTWIVVMDVGFCRYEEGRLLEVFGEDFRAYRQRVRRWM